ncbi:hypothetical protein MMC17_004096 [Xylographa soralifera]|nr:hypothetical protein [Xylographa soralifera]
MIRTYQPAVSTAPRIQLASLPQLAEVRTRPGFNHQDDMACLLTADRRQAGRTTGLGPRMPQHADGRRLDSTHGHTVRKALSSLSSKPGVRTSPTKGYPSIEPNTPVGKREALAKKATASSAATGPPSKPDALVECWDLEQQSVYPVPASRIPQLYNARNPLLPAKARTAHFTIIFPLCADHLITLLQFNALRALAANRTLISGVLTTPLDCDAEIIHIVPYPPQPALLPATLLPTTLQQTVPHGDWIDLFPSPAGRDRLIRAAGTFDEDDLWADCIGGLYEGFPDDEVERRGMVAWAPPWDIAGWEMSEGFWRKWGWLVRGLPGILEATNRWRGERGEEPFVYDD